MFSPSKGLIKTLRLAGVTVCLLIIFASAASAELVLNSPLQITHSLTVQPIIVSNDNGSNTAAFMGNASQEAGIKQNIGLIWGQAGIQVNWLTPNFWNNTFANFGTVASPATRPLSEFNSILTAGQTAGVSAPSNLLSMYFINIVPGFPEAGAPNPLSPLGAEGLATVDGPGSTIRIGASLPGAVLMGDPLGRQLAAKVIAHEIGHNLGLLHIDEAANLMLNSDPTPAQNGINARLNAGQILAARSSQFVTAVPEPSSAMLIIWLAVVGIMLRRRRIFQFRAVLAASRDELAEVLV